MKHKLPELKYNYNALEPFIDQQTMEIHHTKHHAAYINNLNSALEAYPELQEKSLEEILKSLSRIPEAIASIVKNNAGGHYNHTLFWSIMSPNQKNQPQGKLREDIDLTFGSFEGFKEEFSKVAVSRFGSGWAWLVLDSENKLKIQSTANQDSPISDGLIPILCLDVWEHAYYLKYQNRRLDYISQWWNIVDWDEVNKHYLSVMK